MTFTEAALEVLRSASEPLHYKKITELAIERNLLSHVGKTPEVTMSSRLATMVKKDRGQSPIIKVRPGVFAIRETAMDTDKDPSSQPSIPPQTTLETADGSAPAAPAGDRPKLPGADLFPEEEGDDAPILAGLEEETDERGTRRRRRRRRGKGPGDAGPAEAGAEPRTVDRDGTADGNGEGRGVGPGRGPDAGADGRDRGPRNNQDRGPRNNQDRGPRGNQDRGPDRDRGPRGNQDRGGRSFERSPQQPDRDFRGRDEQQPQLDLNRQPDDGDLLGKDLADAAYSVLSRGDRAPSGFARVADMLVRRGRLSGSPDMLAPTVAAALRADAARTARSQGRARFRIIDQRVALTEWLMPREAVRSEENVEQQAEQQRDHVRRAFVNRLNDLPAAGFAELIATWLNAEGVTALRAVRRPGSSAREFHFAGVLRRGAEENRLALVVFRSGRDLMRENVVEARGSLQHYSNAGGAWLITTGRIHPTGREEAASEGGAACALFAGIDLARSMERLGIGMKQHFVALSGIDFDLLEALGDGTPQAGRQDRDQAPAQRPQRDRDEDRGRDRDRGRDDERSRNQNREGSPNRDAAENGVDRNAEHDRESGESQAPAAFDLLDPSIAEDSRLVPEARTQAEADQDDTDSTPSENENAQDSDMAAAQPESSLSESQEDDLFDAGEIDIQEDGDDEADESDDSGADPESERDDN